MNKLGETDTIVSVSMFKLQIIRRICTLY